MHNIIIAWSMRENCFVINVSLVLLSQKVDLELVNHSDQGDDLLEVKMSAYPSSYMITSGVDYELFKHGYFPFTTEIQVRAALESALYLEVLTKYKSEL